MPNTDARMKFAENLSDAIRRSGLMQKEIAAALGVSQQAVSQWASGTRLPDVDAMNALAGVLHTTREKLLDGDVISNADDLVVRDLREAGYYDLSPRDRETVKRLIRSLARRE